LADIVYNRL